MKTKLLIIVAIVIGIASVVCFTLYFAGAGIVQVNSGLPPTQTSSPITTGNFTTRTQISLPTNPPTPKIKTIGIGKKIKETYCIITFKKIEFSYDVLPDNISGYYTHYPANQGKVYINIDADIKNIKKQNLPCDEVLTVTADYNNGYTYEGFPIVEDSSTGFTYANITSITPFETKGMRFLIDCPEEVAKSKKPLILQFSIGGHDYIYSMR